MPPIEFPDKCIKGIVKSDWLFPDGKATLQLFSFQEPACDRSGWSEESINWVDDDGAVDVLLNQKKEEDDQVQFKEGYGVLLRADLDRLRKQLGFSKYFDYERREAEGNPYHGNLLLCDNIEKQRKAMFRSYLALSCTVHRRET